MHLRRTRGPGLERQMAAVNRTGNFPERWRANELPPHHRLALAKVHPGIGPAHPWILDLAKGRQNLASRGNPGADALTPARARSSKYIPVSPACQRFKRPPEVPFWLLRRGPCTWFWPLEERFPTPGLPLRSAISLDLSVRCCWPRFVRRSPFQHSRTCSSEDKVPPKNPCRA